MTAAVQGVIGIPALAGQPRLAHGFSTLELGSVHIKGENLEAGTEARLRFAAQLDIDGDQLAVIGAVHGSRVVRVDRPGVVDGVDGLVTDVRGVALFAGFADCYPILAYDPARHVVGLAHAGWRGTTARIAANLVATLEQEFGSRPGELVAGIGPGICGRCYEVGPEVAERFPSEVVVAREDGHFLLDVGLANRLQLQEAGLSASNVHDSGLCTRETGWLPSHRRDHDGRRFGTLVALR